MNDYSCITVITVVFNAEDIIENTILSVLSQKYPDMEYLVIDGKSKDRTLEIVNRYASKISKIISEPDRGIYDAMNKGVAIAKGEWILFMNAGDTFCNPDVLSKLQMDRVERDVSILYGDSISVYGKDHFYFPARKLETLYHSGMAFCHQAVFVRRSVLLSHPFDLSYKFLADYNLFLSLLLEYFKFKYIPMPVCVYCADGGISDSHQWQCQLEMNRILHRVTTFSSRLYFFGKMIVRRFFLPCNYFFRRCKYRKNLIREKEISKYIY